MATQSGATTWGESLATLRDEVAATSGFSLKQDNSGGAASLGGSGDWFVWSLPSGEDLRMAPEYNIAVGYEYGPDWNTATESWDDEYSVSGTSGDAKFNYELTPREGDYDSASPSDSVAWDLWTSPSGFMFYAERTTGDGRDADFFWGWTDLTQIWNYSNAATRESEGVVGMGGNRRYDENYYREYYHIFGEGGVGSRVAGFGTGNPDSAVDNFPYSTPVVLSSGAYETTYTRGNNDSQTGQTPVAEHSNWFKGGQGAAHNDLIEDSGGTVQFKVKRAYNARLVMRWS